MPEQPLGKDFVGVPCTTLRSKEWKGLQPTTRCLYITMLIKYRRKGTMSTGKVTWTYDELAKAGGLSRRTVRRAMQELKQKDWVTIWEPGGRWKRDTTYGMNPLFANGGTPETTRI